MSSVDDQRAAPAAAAKATVIHWVRARARASARAAARTLPPPPQLAPRPRPRFQTDAESNLLIKLVQKNIKKAATGDAYHVQWDAVVSAFDAASVNDRSKSSLKAHFAATPHSSLAELATGEQTTHAGSRWGASAACGGRACAAHGLTRHPFPTLNRAFRGGDARQGHQ